jgi:hypothetical protein
VLEKFLRVNHEHPDVLGPAEVDTAQPGLLLEVTIVGRPQVLIKLVDALREHVHRILQDLDHLGIDVVLEEDVELHPVVMLGLRRPEVGEEEVAVVLGCALGLQVAI